MVHWTVNFRSGVDHSSDTMAACFIILSPARIIITGMPPQASLVPVSLPLVPRASLTARTSQQTPAEITEKDSALVTY